MPTSMIHTVFEGTLVVMAASGTTLLITNIPFDHTLVPCAATYVLMYALRVWDFITRNSGP
jgi:hypothetical protein